MHALAALMTQVEQSIEPWQRAEGHLLQAALRERLAALGVEPGPDVAAGIMAAALLVAEHTPEWGGNARDALGEVALLGHGLGL